MANSLLQARNIKGLIPALEPKEIQQPYVLDGKNFAVDFEGPYSAFAHQVSSYELLDNPELVETMRVEGEAYIFTSTGIFGYDAVGMRYYPKYIFPKVASRYPWSIAQVGAYYYFCRRDVGLIQHHYTNKTWKLISNAYLPTNPSYITQSYGRLVVLGDNSVNWSALDDGTNFDWTTVLTTGIGYQGLSIVRGKPMGVREVASGFLTFTDQGIMISEYTGGSAVFQHRKLTTTDHIINPYCLITTNERTHVFLTKQGLRVTKGGEPEEYEPLFGQFLFRKLFPVYSPNVQTMYRLFYSSDKQWMFLSVASKERPTIYSKAYVLNMARQEWGSFDEGHYAVGEFYFASGANEGVNLGFIDAYGYSHFFTDAPYKEALPTLTDNSYVYHKPSETETHYDGANCIASSRFHMSGVDEQYFRNLQSGVYDLSYTTIVSTASPYTSAVTYPPDLDDWNTSFLPNEDWAALTGAEDWSTGNLGAIAGDGFSCASGFIYRSYAIKQKALVALDSQVTVGLFRFMEGKQPDEVNTVTNLAVGMYKNGASSVVEDYEDGYDLIDDLASGAGQEDYGYMIPSDWTYGIQVIGSYDGVMDDVVETPTITYDKDNLEYYTCFNSGVYHKVILTASQTFQYLHLKHLEISGFVAGRL